MRIGLRKTAGCFRNPFRNRSSASSGRSFADAAERNEPPAAVVARVSYALAVSVTAVPTTPVPPASGRERAADLTAEHENDLQRRPRSRMTVRLPLPTCRAAWNNAAARMRPPGPHRKGRGVESVVARSNGLSLLKRVTSAFSTGAFAALDRRR